MTIWSDHYTLEDVKTVSDKFMGHYLGLELIELGADFLKGTLPVNEKTKTPFGLLHGGASCVLAESLGSMAAFLCIDRKTQSAVGIEIKANHLKIMQDGFVVGIAKPIHVGRSIQVWEIRIYDEKEEHLVCISRLTMKVLEKRS
jgi:1,4-dihydroxy-2-naphthoyl-CoA hydrolase